MNRTDELLSLLCVPVAGPAPTIWRSPTPWHQRSVYRRANSDQWFLTFSGELPRYHPFESNQIAELLRCGCLEPDNPFDHRSSKDAFHLKAATHRQVQPRRRRGRPLGSKNKREPERTGQPT